LGNPVRNGQTNGDQGANIPGKRRLERFLEEHNVLFHTDAVQAIGKIPVNGSRV